MAGPQWASSDIEWLRLAVRELEKRVTALEQQRPQGAASAPVLASLQARGEANWALAGVAPVIGRAMLALASAYLLRALAESGALPRLLLIAAGICNAGLWLWLAARRRGSQLERLVYTTAATLVFLPLLWESTIRFGLLPHPVTALLLVTFPALSIWWGAGAVIAVLFSSVTAIALIVTSGDMLPFIVSLLLIAALSEAGRSAPIRVISAVAADFAVWMFIWIQSRVALTAGSYKPAGAAPVAISAIILLLIYATSMVLRKRCGGPSILQASIALALTVYATPRAAGGAAVAMVFVFAALSFRPLFSPLPSTRLLQVLSLPLGLIASMLLLPPDRWSLLWALAAPAVSLMGSRFQNRILEVHAVVVLAAAVIASGFPAQLLKKFSSDLAGASLSPSLLIFGSALACYIFASSTWTRAMFAALTSASACAALALAVAPVAGWHHLMVRSAIFCSAAVVIAVAGAHTGRCELLWISYTTLAVSGLTVLLWDFHDSSLTAITIALVCYGAALIIVPRTRTTTERDQRATCRQAS